MKKAIYRKLNKHLLWQVAVLVVIGGWIAPTFSSETANTDSISCVVQPGEVAKLGSAVAGVIDRIHVNRTSYVSQGAVLAELESDVERASLVMANSLAKQTSSTQLRELNAQYGARTLKRNESLYGESSVSKQTLDQVKTEAMIAELQVQQERDNTALALIEVLKAEAVLRRRSIRAPFDGAITQRYKTVGEYVADEPVFELAKLNPLKVDVIVPLDKLGFVEAGMKANVTLDVPLFNDKAYVATVMQIDPVADAASSTYGVTLELPNPEFVIPSGVRCKLKFISQ